MVDESQIRSTAYDLWEQDGRPEGSEETYWHRAREQLESKDNAESFSGGVESGVAQPMPIAGESDQETQAEAGVTVPSQDSTKDQSPIDTDAPAQSDDRPLGDA